ncbi:hypothetical protein G9A89_006535 [Geosiphon pyriformis]|nr:hypothetical protein G9A89_006535 [Geosiphon pyriformis]
MPSVPFIEFEKEKEKPTWETTTSCHQYSSGTTTTKESRRKNLPKISTKSEKLIMTKTNQQTGSEKKRTRKRKRKRKKKPFLSAALIRLSSMGTCCGNNEEYATATKFYYRLYENGIINPVSHVKLSYQTKKYGMTFLGVEKLYKGTLIDNAWKKALMAYMKAEGVTISKLLEIKNNPLSFSEPKYIQTFDYCNECDLIYNPPLHMIYTIPKKDESINNCTLESESVFNPDSNFDNNDDKNTGFSLAQYGNKSLNNSGSDSNPEIYIAFSDLSKKQKLK